MLFPAFSELLVCPACRQVLQEQLEGLLCQGCSSLYPILDGVPMLNSEPAPSSADLAPTLDITILILALNEAENLRHALHETRQVMDGLGVTYEIVIVDGG